MATQTALDRAALCDWYVRNRRRSRTIFDSVRPEAYGDRPIALRNPICFYEGHLPAFSVNTLVKRGLGRPGIDPAYEVLFERGIDPEDEAAVPGGTRWPPREAILAYGDAADRIVFDALADADIDREDNPMLGRGLAAWTILEHEPMHHETLDYMWRRLPYEKKIRPAVCAAARGRGEGASFGDRADPGRPRHARRLERRDPVRLGQRVSRVMSSMCPPSRSTLHSVTNGEYLEFLEANEGVDHPVFWEREGGSWSWRGQWERIPLPLSWPVWVSHAEASAYARWKGRRLPTEAEYHRAAFGTPEGSERPVPLGRRAARRDARQFRFRALGARSRRITPGRVPPPGASTISSATAGNGPRPCLRRCRGFVPMATYPQYSADFFDGKHYVLKGASPVTAKELIRPSFRNWFRGNYPYMYAKFRCVMNGTGASRVQGPKSKVGESS